MSNTFWLAPEQNFTQKTLNGSINDTAQTITLNNTTNVKTPGYAIIDRENSSGTATPNSREFITFTGISGSDLTGVTRAADGSTARSHNDGALVEFVPTTGMWNSLTTIVSSGFTGDGYLKPLASPASLAILRIGTNLNASGASLVGVFPSAASGSVLTSVGNTLPPVFATSLALSSKVITATRDMTAGSGAVGYTGVGFTPSSIIAIGAIDGAVARAFGFVDSARLDNTIGFLANDTSFATNSFLDISSSAGTGQSCVVTSFDVDGFTLTWTKSGSPTGTANLMFMCYK